MKKLLLILTIFFSYVSYSQKSNLKFYDLFSSKENMEISDAIMSKKGGIFKNKTFMFTGKLSEISRAEAKSLVEKNLGKILSSVSNKLDYLIAGEKPTKKKINLAKQLNIKVITQKELENMLN